MDEDGTIKLVEFFHGDKKLGEDSSAPYSFEWQAPNGSHRIWVKATDNSGAYRHARPVDIAVRAQVESPWISQDIGKCAAPGSAWLDGDTWILNAIEDDLYSPDDGYHVVAQPLPGDGEIIVRVESQTGHEVQNMAGLILFDSFENPMTAARIGFCGDNHVRFQLFQDNRQTDSIQSQRFAYAQGWLKLVRQDGCVSAYFSQDGKKWQQVGATVKCELGDAAQMGMFAGASKDVFLNRALFSNVTINF